MIAELVFSYFLVSNQPIRINVDGPPLADYEIRLNLKSKVAKDLDLTISPYVMGENDSTVGRAGADIDLDYRVNEKLTGSLFHSSAHNLDVTGPEMQISGVRLKWKLN